MSLLRTVFQRVARLYPREHGKYSILTRLYFPYLAPSKQTIVESRLRYGIQMHLDLTEYLQAHLYVFGSYELPTIKFMRSVLKPGSVCLDVGAQMGYLSLAMATAAGGATTVHSFEPEDRNAERFLENVLLNSLTNVHLHRTAVSNVNGVLKLYLSSDRNAGTHSTVFVESNVSTEFIEIPSTTLDDFVQGANIPKVDLIKIDVEGAEIDVIKGAVNVLLHHKPVIILELSDHLQNARGFSCKDFKMFMAERGYVAHEIADNGSLRPSAFDASHINDNIAFIHRMSSLAIPVQQGNSSIPQKSAPAVAAGISS